MRINFNEINFATTSDGAIHDQYRIDYFREHIKAMKEAVEDGVNLI